jgi:hypothetical protein
MEPGTGQTKRFSREYFIEKFTAIPEPEIGEGSIEKHCVMYHCGVELNLSSGTAYKYTDEVRTLAKMLAKKLGRNPITNDGDVYNLMVGINDGWQQYKYLGENPRERILTALMQEKNANNIHH